jgi:hypothetical protein
MLESLLSRMDANQAGMLAEMETKMDVNLKENQEAIINKEKTDANQKIL